MDFVPEQLAAGVKVDPLQLAVAHVAVEVRHFPAPSQVFVTPQVLPVDPQRVSVELAAVPEQVPCFPLTLQALQAPHDGMLQQ